MKDFVQREGLGFPMVLARDGKGGLRVVMDSQELASFGGDASLFEARMREKGMLSPISPASL